MSRVDLGFPEVPENETETNIKDHEVSSDNAVRSTVKTRRLLPVYLAGIASIAWTAVAAYFITSGPSISLSQIELGTLASLVSGYTTPIAIFWLAALAFQRTDPLLERRLAISQNLDKAVAPVEIAEQRLIAMNRNLKKELNNIDAVADLAADRLTNLEDRFQSQISDLFSATADTEARTASIRELLEREKDSIEALTKNIETRMNNLETTANTIHDRVETAGSSAASAADHARDRVNTSLEAFGNATEDFEARLDRAGENVSGRVNEVQEIAVEVELRLQAITNKVLGGMEKFRNDVEGLEGRSSELSDHMHTQASVLKELAELTALESAKIEENLKTHVGEVHTAANEALESTNDVSKVFSERAQSMSDIIMDTVSTAKSMLDEAGHSLETHSASALDVSERVKTQTLATTEETGRQVLEHARQVDVVLEDGLERAKRALTATMDQITSHSSNATQEAEDAVERSLQHIRQLRASVVDEIEHLVRTSELAGENLSDSAGQILNAAAGLADQSRKTNDEIETVNSKMNEQSETLSSLLNDTRMKLSRLEEDLTHQRQTLNSVSGDAANQVIDAVERFTSQGQELKEQAKAIGIALENKTLNLSGSITALEEKSVSTAHIVQTKTDNLSKSAEKLDTQLRETSQKLGRAAEAFAGERERVIEEADNVVKNLDQSTERMDSQIARFAENSTEAAERLDAASQSLMDQTERAQQDMRKSVEGTGHELAASMDKISDKANERITFLQEQMQATLSQVLSDYQSTANQAEKESALLASRLGNQASKIELQAENFITKTAEIEKRIVSATKNDFARTSQLLMESLQSSSIDINKALSQDLPDTVWDSYMNGDKSVFMRRTLKIGDRKTRKTIADKCQLDSEFRETVTKYCSNFEGLMERAMIGDKGSALSVTLISSDMGKLYILLGQSLKKFG
jgi:DNA repair exonuclease SbcCD ATPase subunit